MSYAGFESGIAPRRAGLKARVVVVAILFLCLRWGFNTQSATNNSPVPASSLLQTNLAVRRLDKSRIAIGLVFVNIKTRSVTFPAVVNQREGPVEYVLVTHQGKIHESVFRTAVDPHQIHAAMLLLGAVPASTDTLPLEANAMVPGSPVRVEVSWKRGPLTARRPLDHCLLAAQTGRRLDPEAWAYNGSFMADARFAAAIEGSILSLQSDPAALINNPRPSRTDDTFHLSNPKALPPLETRVTFHLTLLPMNTKAAP